MSTDSVHVESDTAEDNTLTENLPDSSSTSMPINVAELPPIQPPAGYNVIGEATGNLDKDSTPEKVIVYDTPKEVELGTERQIHIYKANKHGWELWHKSIGAVLPSRHGGMMGDPFDGIEIQRGAIVISHFGGSRQKWTYTHRFRNQNGSWELIGATVHYGAPCDYWEDLDYNLSTGKVLYTNVVENCDTDEEKEEKEAFTRTLRTLPSMDGFYPGDTEVQIPNRKESMWY